MNIQRRLIGFTAVMVCTSATAYKASKTDYLPQMFEKSKYHSQMIKVPSIHYDRYLQSSWENEMLTWLERILSNERTEKKDKQTVE